MLRWLVGGLIFVFSINPATAASLREAFEAAVSLSPELRTLEARRAIVDARLRSANALTPSAPNLGLGYTSDRMTQNRGFQETEVEFGVPIWLPGQSRAQRTLAQADGERLAAQLAERRLVIAGEVRDAYWAWAMAESVLAAGRVRTTTAGAVLASLSRQVRAGQSPRSEELLAIADTKESEALVREATIAARDARLAFRALTGREPMLGWVEVAREFITPPDHPRMLSARLAVDVARASIRVAEVEDRDSPEVAAFLRRERDDRFSGWDTRIGVRVRIPFAHPPRNATQRAGADAELAGALAELDAAERLWLVDRERARSTLSDTRAAAVLAEERCAALASVTALGEGALRAGQAALAETLRLRASLAAANVDCARAQIAVQQAISRYNQAIGIEP